MTRKIIVLLPLTGIDSTDGLAAFNLIKNNKNLIIRNTRSLVSRFIKLVKYYVRKGFRYFVGGITSDEVIIWINEIQINNNCTPILISPSSTAKIDLAHPSVFRLCPDDTVLIQTIRNYLSFFTNYKIGVISFDDFYGRSIISLTVSIFPVVSKILLYTDFNDVITEYQDPDIDYWIIGAYINISDIIDNKSVSSVLFIPGVSYNNDLIDKIPELQYENIIGCNYLGLSSILSLYRLELHEQLEVQTNIFAINTLDACNLFDYIQVKNSTNLKNFSDKIIHFTGYSGRFQFNIENDRNNDAISLAFLDKITVDGKELVLWQEKTYTSFKLSVTFNNELIDTIVSFFSPNTISVNYTFSRILANSSLTIINQNCNTYTINDVDLVTFNTSVLNTLVFENDEYLINIPSTASFNTLITASIYNKLTMTNTNVDFIGQNRTIVI